MSVEGDEIVIRAMAVRGFALLGVVVVLGIMGVLAATVHVVGMDRWRLAWALRESSAALYAAEAGLEVSLASWDTSLMAGIAPGARVGITAGRLSSGDSYRVEATRLDDGVWHGRYYLLESIGRSHGAWRGRRALAMFVKVGASAEATAESARSGGFTAAEGEGSTLGSAAGPPELHLPHPLAQFRWLQILE